MQLKKSLEQYKIIPKFVVASGVTDRGAKGRSVPTGKLNVTTGPPLIDILLFSIPDVIVFCVFRSVFVFLESTDIHDIQRFTIIS